MTPYTSDPHSRDGTVRPTSSYAPPPSGNWRLAAVRRVLLARRGLLAGVSASVLLVGLVALVLIPRRYTSRGSFVVEAAPAAGLSSAMAIISQLNPNLAGGDSPKFYVDLIGSRPVLEHLLALAPHARCSSPGRTVLEIISGHGADPRNIARSVETLRHRTSSGYDLRTGVISVGLEAECPELARELADSLIASINGFNIDRRQTRAKLRREFSEQRANEADAALRDAEDALSSFQASNRVITTPRLELESERLRRRITEREEMASSLRREANAARLDEINSIPALTIVEPPDLPVRPSYPKRRLVAVALAVMSVAIGIAVVLILFARGDIGTIDDPGVERLHAELRRLWPRRRTARP